ncbi:histidine decarboxylase-like protein [Leptotrombidium deliense]|uniref:40S ribosomal protein S27 n=1 Tax=Leptotrombidium deliense TaxID=299467 RepID=A0A443SRJ9_9ACAR|nr:histidine decarboxylase-like protein [Leptotrombidium deliense]
MPLAKDLLHPSPEEERRKCKLKRLVQHPNSYFMDVKCPGCLKITTVFSHAQTVVQCKGCATILCTPTGGKARLRDAAMDWEEYRVRGKEMVDFIADYLSSIRERRVFPDVKPGYMRHLIPSSAPEEGEKWQTIFTDVERVIMPGVTHWQSPYMHAYFPALNSPASLLGDMLADAIGCLGFTWASSPACTELEIVVMDWLAKMIQLPDEFLFTKSDSRGGGVIQTTASEATFVALLAARTEAIRKVKMNFPDDDDSQINSLLVAYCSDQAHSSVEKAGLIGLVKMRYIESDENLSLDADILAEAIKSDRETGLIPFFVCATLGTTGACAFDNLKKIGPICKSEQLWLHVDAAYAGTAFICPEFRHWIEGINYVQSFAFNPSKWLMVHFDCTAMWVTDSSSLHRTFNVEPLYLKHENSGLAVDYMHWQIPLSKRFRALKLWFVLRNYGIKGLQEHVRKGVHLAEQFKQLVEKDERFEVPFPKHLGMVVFRLKGDNELTEKLLKRLNSQGKIHCVPASLKGVYVIRFTVTSTHTTLMDIKRDWKVIQDMALEVIRMFEIPSDVNPRIRNLAEIKKRTPDFGTSLLLANSPMTPKIVNGSFVAIFDNQDVVQEFVKHFGNSLKLVAQESPALRKRIKGLMLSNKQYSLDSRIDLMNSIMATIDMSDTSKIKHKLNDRNVKQHSLGDGML